MLKREVVDMVQLKRVNTFEKIILVVGVMVLVAGFYLIGKMISNDPVISWPLIQSIALWSLLILMLILTDSNESIKEERTVVIDAHRKETRQLKKISAEQLKEVKLLRKVFSKKKR